jgi:hypothetical protein
LSWVTGPNILTERKFNVMTGTYVVLLVNGRAREKVYTAGRAGGITHIVDDNRVPLTGELKTMVFNSAVNVPTLKCADVRLADGATIAVSADVEVKPAWSARTRMLLDWIERYGANAASIEQHAKAALDGDFASLVRSSFEPLTHVKVHSAADKRSLLKSVGHATGLLAIDRILNVTCTRDEHAERAHALGREGLVTAARVNLETLEFKLRQQLDEMGALHANAIAAISADGELAIARKRAETEALINRTIAAFYGISPAEVAFPQLLTERQRIELETVQSVLTQNADTLPLLAEVDADSAVRLLRQMFSGTASPAPGTPPGVRQPVPATTARSSGLPLTALPSAGEPQVGPQRWPSAPDVAARLAAAGITDRVVGSAVCDGPHGIQRIALTASGSDRLVGGIGIPGNTNAIVVRERSTLLETVNALLAAAAQWCGYALAYDPPQRTGSGGPLLIDISQVSPRGGQTAHPNALLGLAACIRAINTLMADTTPQVSVSVLGQR